VWARLNFTSKKAYKVAKYLLGNIKTSQREIHRETGVSLGYVNEIINYSLDIGVLKREKGYYAVDDPVRLLEKIGFDRPFKGLETNIFRLPAISIAESESLLIEQLESNDLKYTFTAFSGLRRYFEYHISYPLIHIYVENSSVTKVVEQGEGAVPVIILKADRPDIWKDSKRVKESHVCDQVQVIIDLFSSGIGRDAAIKFLEAIRVGRQENSG